MLDPVHDECGIAAIYRMDVRVDGGSQAPGALDEERNAVRILPDMLIDLQNRGQLSAGIARYNEHEHKIIDIFKDVGSVSDVFRLTHPDPAKFRRILDRFGGRAGIGHVRYATCGGDDRSSAQPFEQCHPRKWKWFAFCFNGNIANYAEVREKILEKRDYHLRHDTDTEVLKLHLSYALRGEEKPDFVKVFRHIADTMDGAYSLAFLNADGDLVLARDPNGFRPLCYATMGSLFGAASESLALVNRGFTDIKDLEPGELLHVRPDGVRKQRFAESPKKSFCFFEYVYFANVASTLNGRSVYLTRKRLGEALADGEQLKTDPRDCVAVPVPDTAKAACDGMAYRLGIPSLEGLIRNRYVGRTFIEGRNRIERARRKYTALPEVLKDKRVFLVEDSIVRSTTLRVIIKMLREQGGAKEVHVRVSCPPIMAPCSYGIDMSTVSELFAPKLLGTEPREVLSAEDLKKLSDDLGTDSLRYLTLDELKRAIGPPNNELCLGCLTGKNPTPWGEKLYAEALRLKDTPQAGRTYEKMVAPTPKGP
ncbi:MAG TPA: amidophosphoribosyltransferase [Planctomycetota bacterium]|nr:amidophosphoribosyltransferase [Planctomycetota bacterium]